MLCIVVVLDGGVMICIVIIRGGLFLLVGRLFWVVVVSLLML